MPGLSVLFDALVQEGVGDTPDSYAYDGNRVRKWNVTTTNYGKVSTVPQEWSRKQVTPSAHWILLGLVKSPQAFLSASVCVPALVCTLEVLGMLALFSSPSRLIASTVLLLVPGSLWFPVVHQSWCIVGLDVHS